MEASTRATESASVRWCGQKLGKERPFTVTALTTSGYLQTVTVHMGKLQLSYLLSHLPHCKVSVYQLLEKFTMVSLSKIFSHLRHTAGLGRVQHKHFNVIVLNWTVCKTQTDFICCEKVQNGFSQLSFQFWDYHLRAWREQILCKDGLELSDKI